MEQEGAKGWPFEVSIVFLFQGTAIIILNVLCIIVFWRKRTTLKRTSYFLVNLAVADTLVGVVEVTTYCLHDFLGVNELLVALSSIASLFSLSFISLERLFATWKPLRHRATSTKYYFIAISLLWICSTSDGVLYMLHTKEGPTHNVTISCLLAVSIAFILCTILFSYTAIWYVVVFHPRPVHHNREQNKKLTKTLFIVTALSLLIWTPTLVKLAVAPKVSWRIDVTINTLLYANSLVNPIVYIFRMQEFREELKRLLCRSCLSSED